MLQQFYDVTPDMVQGGPKFMDEDRWDITAKMISTDPGQHRKPTRKRELS